jgi:hypothetical protein
MKDSILIFCNKMQQLSIEAQDWPAAQNYQDMHSMWAKRFEQNELERAKAA